jgi:hypothetical protein
MAKSRRQIVKSFERAAAREMIKAELFVIPESRAHHKVKALKLILQAQKHLPSRYFR